jgi:Lon-like protease
MRPARAMSRVSRVVAASAIAAAVAAAALLVPIPIFYVEQPGPVQDVERRVDVSGARTYSSEGHLYLTTVGVDVRVTAAEILLAALEGDKQVVYARDITGGRSLPVLERQQRRLMTESKRAAEVVALSELGLGTPTGDGARVVNTDPATPADGVLESGDVITRANGRAVATTCDLGRAIDAAGPGATLGLTVDRAGDTRTLSLRIATNPIDGTSPYIGVALRDVGYRFDPRVDVGWDTGNIAGPSAGLMFALALYDRLTPGDLTAGRTIAGTGTIDCGGGVGPIGGIGQKVAAAEVHGADLFLVPRADAAAARSGADDIEIVPVSSFRDALRRLSALAG